MIRFVLADLGRFRLGSAVMVALVALAVALGVTITLQERALRLGSARASEKFDLVIGAPGSETQLVLSSVFLQPAPLPLLPGDTLRALARDPRVAWAAPIGFGDFAGASPIVGTTTPLVSALAPGFTEGRIFAAEGEAVIGAAVDLAVGRTVTPSHGRMSEGGHMHEGIAYRVTGRMAATGTPWDRAILVPIQAVWHTHGMGEDHDASETEATGHGQPEDHDHAEEGPAHAQGHDHSEEDHDHAQGPAPSEEDHDHAEGLADAEEGHDHAEGLAHPDPGAPLVDGWQQAEPPGIPAILVKPRTIADAYRLRQEYRTGGRSLAVFPAEVLTGLYALLGDARLVLAAVAAGAQALVAAALLLVTVIQVGQRRRQIGALRAFGAPRSAVFGIVWLELFLLAGSGILLGFLGGWLSAWLLSETISAGRGFPLPVEFQRDDLAGLALLVGSAALLSALPAWLAYRQPPVAALRG